MHDIYEGICFETSSNFLDQNLAKCDYGVGVFYLLIIVYVETNYVCIFTQCLEVVINYLIDYDLLQNRCLC